MKHLLCSVLVIMMLLSVLPVSGNAAEQDKEVIYFQDGSYMTIELIENGFRASGSKSGSKRSTYYGSNGATEWVAVLSGNFNYTGSSATCTSSSMNVTIYDSDWYVISKSASKSGNSATGSAVMGLKNAGVTVTRVPVSLTLQCDANGNLS